MDEHDEVCLCFHVTRCKLEKYIRLEQPVRESQLSECYGAGTGCGWCRPFLKSLFDAARAGDEQIRRLEELTSEEYASRRKAWREQQRKN